MDIIDNAISSGYQEFVRRTIQQDNFPWYFNEKITTHEVEKGDKNSGFSNLIYDWEREYQSEHFDMLIPILYESLDKIGLVLRDLLRVRVGMFVKNQCGDNHHLPHVDYDFDHHTMLYYVIDSDGPTFFFDGDEIVNQVDPKIGRSVIFDGKTLHASSTPKSYAKRIVINYNFVL